MISSSISTLNIFWHNQQTPYMHDCVQEILVWDPGLRNLPGTYDVGPADRERGASLLANPPTPSTRAGAKRASPATVTFLWSTHTVRYILLHSWLSSCYVILCNVLVNCHSVRTQRTRTHTSSPQASLPAWQAGACNASKRNMQHCPSSTRRIVEGPPIRGPLSIGMVYHWLVHLYLCHIIVCMRYMVRRHRYTYLLHTYHMTYMAIAWYLFITIAYILHDVHTYYMIYMASPASPGPPQDKFAHSPNYSMCGAHGERVPEWPPILWVPPSNNKQQIHICY